MTGSLSHREDAVVTMVRRAQSTNLTNRALMPGLWNACSDMQCFGNVPSLENENAQGGNRAKGS
jgi:hypothetical protein